MKALTTYQALSMNIPFIWMGTDDQQRFIRDVFNFAKSNGIRLCVWNKFAGLYEIVNYRGLSYVTSGEVRVIGNSNTAIVHIHDNFLRNLKYAEENQPEKDMICIIQNPDIQDIKDDQSVMIGYAESFENNANRFKDGTSPYHIIILTPDNKDVNPFPLIIRDHMVDARMADTTADTMIEYIQWFAHDRNVSISEGLVSKFAKALSGYSEFTARKVLEYAYSFSVNEIDADSFSKAINIFLK